MRDISLACGDVRLALVLLLNDLKLCSLHVSDTTDDASSLLSVLSLLPFSCSCFCFFRLLEPAPRLTEPRRALGVLELALLAALFLLPPSWVLGIASVRLCCCRWLLLLVLVAAGRALVLVFFPGPLFRVRRFAGIASNNSVCFLSRFVRLVRTGMVPGWLCGRVRESEAYQ